MSNVEANKVTAQKICDAISDQNWGHVRTFFADDATLWVAGSSVIGGTHTVAFIDQLAQDNTDKYPNGFNLITHAVTAEGNRVAVEAESRADHVSGKFYNNFYHVLFVFNDQGMVQEYKEYMDTAHVDDVFFGQ